MHQLALEVPEAVNFGPRDVVQPATRRHEHVGRLLEHLARREVLDLDVPSSYVLV